MTTARREAEIRALVADYHAKNPHIAELPNLDYLLRIIDAERAKNEGLRKALQLIADGCEVSSAGDVWPSHILDPQLVARAALSASPSPILQTPSD